MTTEWTYERARAALGDRINYEALATGPGRVAAPNTERMRRLVDLLDHPQRAYPVIHLTGTNGKTSTARMVSALLEEMGLTVGMYTSPDLGRLNERFQRNSEPISDAELAEALGGVLDVEPLVDGRLTYFEVLTATAFRWFAEAPVDVAVVEVGMLGRFDTTNVADGQVAVVTNVGLDHLAFAGPTRAHVAREKAGIIKPGATLILGETDPELQPIFAAEEPAATWLRHEDFGCSDNRLAHGGRLLDLFTPGASYPEVFLPLHGAHQGDNAAAALAAVEAFFDSPLSEEIVNEGLGRVRSPGRMEVVGRQPLVVLDGAHNQAGMEAMAATLADEFDVAGRLRVVFGALRGHGDVAELLTVFERGSVAEIIVCAVDWPRAIPPAELAAAARQSGHPVSEAPTVAAALDRVLAAAAPDDLVLVTGSLYVVGEARRILG